MDVWIIIIRLGVMAILNSISHFKSAMLNGRDANSLYSDVHDSNVTRNCYRRCHGKLSLFYYMYIIDGSTLEWG